MWVLFVTYPKNIHTCKLKLYQRSWRIYWIAVTVLLLVHTNKLIFNYTMINAIYQKLLKPGNYLVLCLSKLTTLSFWISIEGTVIVRITPIKIFQNNRIHIQQDYYSFWIHPSLFTHTPVIKCWIHPTLITHTPLTKCWVHPTLLQFSR